MSSKTFEVRIRIDPLSRRLVVAAGYALTLAGAFILAVSQLPISWRAAGLVFWLIGSALQFRDLRRAYRQVSGIVLNAAGELAIFNPGGERIPVRRLPGSFAVPSFAWFRLRLPDGSRYAELLIRQRISSLDWHRLQLAWKQGPRTFGHRGPA